MQIETIAEWALSREDERAIADLVESAFDADFGGRSFYKTRQHLRIVARDAGRIVGHMALSYRAMRLGPDLIDTLGLADVATAPDRRGEGIATALMQTVIAEAKATPAEFLLLFGDQPLYAASGFAARRNPIVYVAMHNAHTLAVRQEAAESLMVLPLRGKAWDEAAPLDLSGSLF